MRREAGGSQGHRASRAARLFHLFCREGKADRGLYAGETCDMLAFL